MFCIRPGGAVRVARTGDVCAYCRSHAAGSDQLKKSASNRKRKAPCPVVGEASTDAQRRIVFDDYMKKGTFPSEREWDHIRLFKGAQSTIRCRTWLLRNRSGGELLAALTIRFNPYNGRCGRWAQIMSAAALQKRCGHGTLLVQTTMAILKENSDVDVMVVYPSDNQKALQFWKKVGSASRAACRLLRSR